MKISDLNKFIGRYIASERKKLGYTQKEFAYLLYVNPTTYNGYEKGKHSFPLGVLMELSFMFNINIDNMFTSCIYYLNEGE